ncbi:unnamed protein product, partial [Aureobasidium uvarum]
MTPNNMTIQQTLGYPGLAKVMGAQMGLSIYLGFADLNARDLLVYQAEILHLEQQLEVHDQITPWGKNNILKPLGEERTLMEQEHWNVQMNLRSILKDYIFETDEALLRQAKIQRLETPSHHDLKVMTRWLEHETGGNNFLSGFEDLPWTEGRASDLVVLSTREKDRLSERMIPWFLRRGLISGYSKERYTTASRTISVVTSSLIPSLAIVILYFIHSLLVRIFVAMGLSFLFSIALALLTSARAAEIFASTTA